MPSITLNLPSFWSPYLINGDTASMSLTEVQECDEFMIDGRYDAILGEANLWNCVIDVADTDDFRWVCDFPGYSGTCAEYTFTTVR